MQKDFVEGIDKNLDKVVAYKDYIETKIGEFKTRLEETTDENEKQKLAMFISNVEYFQSNLIVLI
jgi:SPX domain protein involved in polyphosphate accumulation